VDILYKRAVSREDVVLSARAYVRHRNTDLVIEALDEFGEFCTPTTTCLSTADYIFEPDTIVARG
jgi:hypothetical protein